MLPRRASAMAVIPAGDLSQLPRKTLQDLAKEHGLKANGKSQVLAEQLQALRDRAKQPAAAAGAAAAAAKAAENQSPIVKRLSSLFASVTGPSTTVSPFSAGPPSTSHKRGRDAYEQGVDTIDEQAPLQSPLDPARRQSKIMKLSTAGGESWCVSGVRAVAFVTFLSETDEDLKLAPCVVTSLTTGRDESVGRWTSSARSGQGSSPRRAASPSCGARARWPTVRLRWTRGPSSLDSLTSCAALYPRLLLTQASSCALVTPIS